MGLDPLKLPRNLTGHPADVGSLPDPAPPVIMLTDQSYIGYHKL